MSYTITQIQIKPDSCMSPNCEDCLSNVKVILQYQNARKHSNIGFVEKRFKTYRHASHWLKTIKHVVDDPKEWRLLPPEPEKRGLLKRLLK